MLLGLCSPKRGPKRTVLFILCISVPYLIIFICYVDILRTVRKSRITIRHRLASQVSELTTNNDDNVNEMEEVAENEISKLAASGQSKVIDACPSLQLSCRTSSAFLYY